MSKKIAINTLGMKHLLNAEEIFAKTPIPAFVPLDEQLKDSKGLKPGEFITDLAFLSGHRTGKSMLHTKMLMDLEASPAIGHNPAFDSTWLQQIGRTKRPGQPAKELGIFSADGELTAYIISKYSHLSRAEIEARIAKLDTQVREAFEHFQDVPDEILDELTELRSAMKHLAKKDYNGPEGPR